MNVHIRLAGAALIALLAGLPAWATAATEAVPLRMDARFSGFDIIGHIRRDHPELAAQATAISHWAAYHGVNPFVLERLATKRTSPGPDTIEQLAQSLATVARPGGDHRPQGAATKTGPASTLETVFSMSAQEADEVLSLARNEMMAAALWRTQAVTADRPPALDLPFAQPLRWQFNGAHTFTGRDGNGDPMSSLDFTSSWSQRWGDDTTADVVAAAHDGEVTVYSDCFVQVQHPSGWATRYYHLDGVSVITGAQVTAGDPIGIYAGNRMQALCSGGSSTGPHVHFSLVRDGEYTSLDQVSLSGYVIHPGENSYDSSHDRMWLEKRGQRFYAYSIAIGQAAGDNVIDYRYNGMWYTPTHTGHGLNVEITELPSGNGPRKAVFIVLYTYDDAGEANFYVGNRDFERWRSDEIMAIDLLQTAGGDLANLSPIDFGNPDHVQPAGQAELLFEGCNTLLLDLQLLERTSGQPAEHTLELVRLIGVPPHVCEAPSLPLP